MDGRSVTGLDDYLANSTGGGWEQPAPVTEIRIPENAGPGSPGILITRDIPAELVAYYPAPFDLDWVRIGFTSSTNVYYYEGVIADSVELVTGWVFAGTVNETAKHQQIGAGSTRLWYGFDAASTAGMVFGPNAGLTTAETLYQRGHGLRGTVDCPLSWDGEVRFGQGKLLTEIEKAAVNLAYSPVTAVPTLLAGSEITVTAQRAGAVWEADYSADMDLTVVGAATTVVQLDLDGFRTSPQIVWNPANVAVGARSGGLSQSDYGVLVAPGNYTFGLYGHRAAGAGTIRINSVHTRLKVKIYE